ncbi:MAG: tetratricopeptide repeat protein [Candidatus Schekmanbacteria bacterium]|nr:tetratricopeptide repeat protein [Candidatus Schekmanbacteria bacterium]
MTKVILKMLCFFFLVIMSFECSAEVKERQESIFLEANNLYAAGKYEQALNNYMKIAETGLKDENLFYNIGNSYFRLGRTGLAILYYEKSIILNPRDQDVAANLQYAKKIIVDKIDERGSGRLLKTLFLHDVLSLRELVSLFLSLYLFFWVLLIIRIKYKNVWTGRTALSCFLLLLFCAASLGSIYWSNNIYERAVITDKEADVRSGNDVNSVTLFRLHEGSEAFVLDKNGSWVKIELEDGKKGWIQKSSIKNISDNL